MSRIAENAYGDTPAPYPESPGWKAPGTSREAAHKMRRGARDLQGRVLAMITRASPAGLTADEVAGRLSVSILSVRPRVSELGKQEKIERTGERRANESGLRADVWRERR